MRAVSQLCLLDWQMPRGRSSSGGWVHFLFSRFWICLLLMPLQCLQDFLLKNISISFISSLQQEFAIIKSRGFILKIRVTFVLFFLICFSPRIICFILGVFFFFKLVFTLLDAVGFLQMPGNFNAVWEWGRRRLCGSCVCLCREGGFCPAVLL